MRIIHIITDLDDGGAEAVLFRLCKHDTVNRHTVVTLMDEGKYGLLLRNAGVAVHCLFLSKGRFRVSSLVELWRMLRHDKPDVVQTWMYHADLLGGLIARLAGVRNVFWGIRHSTFEINKSSSKTVMIARILALLSRIVPRRIAVCAEKAVMVHGELGYDTGRMVVIPNGYDVDQFAPNQLARRRLRSELFVPDGQPLLGMVGRYDPQKDHLNLISALASLKAQGIVFSCVLVGSGISSDNIQLSHQLEVAGLKDQVILLGQRNDIPEVMNALDVHVLSSAYGEAFPNVLSESMACGTPCVSTDVGDSAVIVGDAGWIVPPRDSSALANSILHALQAFEDPDSWGVLQRASRRRVQDHFGINRMVEAYNCLWSNY